MKVHKRVCNRFGGYEALCNPLINIMAQNQDNITVFWKKVTCKNCLKKKEGKNDFIKRNN